MRPVARGNPAGYPLDYLTAPTASAVVVAAVANLQEVVAAERAVVAAAATVEGQLAAAGASPNNRKRPHDGTGVGSRLPDIQAARPGLQNAYDLALVPPVDVPTLRAAGVALLANLRAEEGWYKDRRSALTKQVGRVWGLARGDLIANIGEYCSYCEMPIGANLAIEHMLPKRDFPSVSLSWPNFLLACAVCNGRKKDRPSRTEGIAAAVAGGIAAPTEAEVQAGALGTWVWPADATGYPAWQTTFAYRMTKVAYDTAGNLVWSVEIPDAAVARWGFANTRVEVLSDAGHAVTAQVAEHLGEIADGVVGIGDELSAGRFPDPLRTAVANLPWQYRFTGGPDPAVAVLAPGYWRLTQVRRFTVDTTVQNQPTVSETTTGTPVAVAFVPPATVRGRRAFLTNLGRGVLPGELRAVLCDPAGPYLVDPVAQSVTITAPDRTTYAIDVVKTVDVAADGWVLQLLSVRRHDLELRVVALAGPRQAEAQRVVDAVGLNRVDRSDTRFSDRRMVRRTRAWFTALAAVRNISDYVTAGGAVRPPGNELLDLVVATAAATGYWSVWLDVMRRFTAPELYAGLTQPVLGAANFPGTR